jgi:hypothetical protein
MARLDQAISWGAFTQIDAEALPRGWRRCSALVDDPVAVLAWRDEVLDLLATDRHVRRTDVPDVVGDANVLTWYCDSFAWIGAALFHADRRVPRLSPDAVAFHTHPTEGWVDAVALLRPEFWCLPDDPDAEHPDAQVLADEQVLAQRLRSEVTAHAGRFIATLAPLVRLGRRSLWGAVTDTLDSAPWACGNELGREAAGVADSRLLLDRRHPPLTAASGTYEVIDHHGRRWWSRHRQTCCFFYRMPSTETCFTCPRSSDDERSLRASSWPDAGPDA